MRASSLRLRREHHAATLSLSDLHATHEPSGWVRGEDVSVPLVSEAFHGSCGGRSQRRGAKQNGNLGSTGHSRCSVSPPDTNACSATGRVGFCPSFYPWHEGGHGGGGHHGNAAGSHSQRMSGVQGETTARGHLLYRLWLSHSRRALRCRDRRGTEPLPQSRLRGGQPAGRAELPAL
jgi:hypothetical protein